MRDFTRDDQPAVQDLILRGLRERWGDAYQAEFNPEVADITVNYVARGAEVVVFDDGGEIVATGTLRPDADERGRIVRMSVDARHRRRGLGRQVVEELVVRARRRRMTEVRVSTDTPWTSAMALYRACGFEQVDADATDTHFSMRL